MFKSIARWSALAVAFTVLTVPASRMYADPTTPPTVVTGGDPQPTGEAMTPVILLLPSLVVL